MNNVSIFWLQLVASCVVSVAVVVWWVWPSIIKLSPEAALSPLIFVHVFRYVGMSLLVTGMVDAGLPLSFRASAAYGDLVTAGLAFVSILALKSKWRIAIALVWVFNTWGFVDLLNGVRGLLQLNVPSFNLGSFWYVYTFYAPAVLISHLMIFWILIRYKSWQK